MLQLIKFGASTFRGSLPVSLPSLSKNTSLSSNEKTCILCKHLNINYRLQNRNQSTVTHVSTEKPKNRVRRKRKYADVLVVTDKSSRVEKANVSKLTAKDLFLLVTTNLNLNELYKIKQLSKKKIFHQASYTYSDFAIEPVPLCGSEISHNPRGTVKNVGDNETVVASLNGIPESLEIKEPLEDEAEELTEIDTELEFKSIPDALQPEVVEVVEIPEIIEVKKEELNKSNHVDWRHKREIAARTLAAYMEMCNYLKNPNRGLSALYYHQFRVSREPLLGSTTDVNVFCTLLKGFAQKGDYSKLTKVLGFMQEYKVKPSVQCYVAIFDCLGRINIKNQYLKDIRIFIKEAQNNAISLNRIMNEGTFLNDERARVLKVFNAADPTYVPHFEKPNFWYNNHLLDHLNLSEDPPKAENYLEGAFTRLEMEKRVQKQLKLESEGYVTVKNVASDVTPSKELEHYRKSLGEHLEMWEREVRRAFRRDLATLSAQKYPLNLEPFMRCVPEDEYVRVIVEEAKRIAQGSETYSPEAGVIYKRMANRVYAKYQVLQKQKSGVLEKIVHLHTKYCQDYATDHAELDAVPRKILTNPRIQWQKLEHDAIENGPSLHLDHKPWVPSTLTHIGKFLYHIIKHDLRIDVNCMKMNSSHKNFLPAFYTIFRHQGRIVKEEVKPHPVLSKLYKGSQQETLTFPVNEVPMTCPPVPWTSIHNGGYMIAPTIVVRLPPHACSQWDRMKESDPVQLYPSLDALNQLSAVPWKVNCEILDVILEVFRKGGSSKLDVPEPPSVLPTPPSFARNLNKQEKHELIKQKQLYKRKKAEMYSLWCDCLYRLSLANHFRDEIFWLPHNMDFRGRVYPVPPHLNHLGSDLARSMLVFAESRPLGPKGFDWIKIHLINLTGLKKRNSIRDRLNYANDIIGLILDSADHPLTGQKWWAQSDEPWQTLACCMEIANIIRSGLDPAEYRSHFPVHQDGSCNGLQHYAALGRDSAGAHSVNLAPSKTPQDVYSSVVALVEERRAKDEQEGIEVAKLLNGFIKRKVIKQTIMTTVYGVTRFGARLQIAKQLKDIDDFPKDAVWPASSYLTSRTFDSLRTMFTSTREIQDWFTECAKLISGVGGHLVEWVTPMGLPIVQPYFKYKKKSMPPGFDAFSLDHYEKPNTMKQKNAFPPNFIHSLDSSHMMLTSLNCERAGLTFVSVHDCYWTHPSTVDIMNKICREQFVALHSEPILEDLSVFLFKKYSFKPGDSPAAGNLKEISIKRMNKILRQLPNKGDFDIKNVLKSTYFFS